MFAIEHTGVEPDIVTIAKGIASGLPLGVATARSEVMSWPPGTHASTFGGNPVSCAAALATIRLLRDGLMKNAEAVGAHMMAGAKALMDKHPIVGDVRGRGLMIGIELVRDRQTKERATTERDALVRECFKPRPAGARRRPQRHPPVAAARADEGAGRHRGRDPRPGADRDRPLHYEEHDDLEDHEKPYVVFRVLRDRRVVMVQTAAQNVQPSAAMPADGRQSLGKMGEDLACAELARRGYAILERRYRTRFGEIDIVARDGATSCSSR